MAEEKTKEYVLKPGMKHSFIKGGEARSVRGDGKKTVELTERQAIAFKDKLMGENLPKTDEDEEIPFTEKKQGEEPKKDAKK